MDHATPLVVLHTLAPPLLIISSPASLGIAKEGKKGKKKPSPFPIVFRPIAKGKNFGTIHVGPTKF